MNKFRISAFAAGVCASIFGILYPEYVLLPGVYEYITVCDERDGFLSHDSVSEMTAELLFAEPDQIRISSYFIEKWSAGYFDGD